MKLQKIILCVAVALTAFGASLGLLEIGRYMSAAVEPVRVEIKPVPMPSIVYQPKIVELQQPERIGVAETDKTEEKDYCEFNEAGDYYLVSEKEKGFTDFESLTIITSVYDEELDKVIPIKPKGSLFAAREREFEFSWLNITNKRISFVTESKKGLSYQFDGKFVDEELKVKAENGEEYTEQVVLKGRLTKWLNGVRIAESKVKFGEMCGC